jgi:Ankyrin repeats (many copies)
MRAEDRARCVSDRASQDQYSAGTRGQQRITTDEQRAGQRSTSSSRPGPPVNQADAEWGRLPLHVAAGNGRPASVRRLLAHGADPALRDPRHHCTPLEECQREDRHLDSPGHAEAEAILRPLTPGQDASAPGSHG